MSFRLQSNCAIEQLPLLRDFWEAMLGKVYLTAIGICFLANNLLGQTSAPKFSNEFLSIGVGARAIGMANSVVANVDDVTAGYWNPAGLLDIQSKYEFSLMHAEYFAGIAKYDYAAFATPIDSSNHLAFSIIRFGVDDIPDTRFLYDANGVINYDNIRFFSAADYAFLVSYARRLKWLNGLKLGGNFKVIHRNVGTFAQAWGFGLDFGAQLSLKKWKFGLMLRDAVSTFNAWTHSSELVADIYTQTGNEIPKNSVEITLPKLLLGVSRGVAFGERFGLLSSLDLDFTFDGKRNVPIKTDPISIDPHLGLEFDYVQTVFVRAGVGSFQQIKDFDGTNSTSFQPNFGIGAKVKQLTVNYALTDIGDQSESLYSHIFSIKVSLE